jgi:hypothetical protein
LTLGDGLVNSNVVSGNSISSLTSINSKRSM